VGGRIALATLIASSIAGTASADDLLLDARWPGMAADGGTSLEQQITDHLTDLGNELGTHMHVLSHEVIGLKVDGRARRARFRLTAGDAHYLSLDLDSDWLFSNGKARIAAKVDLGVAGRVLHVELPDMEMIPDSYHGSQLVQINVPLLERRW
jgi:hypothetical protein